MSAAPAVGVGPVLEAGDAGRALVAAIQAGNAGTEIQDRGSYWRVLVPRRCVLSRAEVERHLGRPFRLPGDLEAVMPSFRGVFRVDEDQAEWLQP